MSFPNHDSAANAFRTKLNRSRIIWSLTTAAYAAFVVYVGTLVGFEYYLLFLVGPAAYPAIRALNPLGSETLRVLGKDGAFEKIYAVTYEADGSAGSKWGPIAKYAGIFMIAPATIAAEVSTIPTFLWVMCVVGVALLLFAHFSSNSKIGFLWFTFDTIELVDRRGNPSMRVDRDDVQVHEYKRDSAEKRPGLGVEFSLPSRDGKGPYRVRVAAEDAGEFRFDLGENRSGLKISG